MNRRIKPTCTLFLPLLLAGLAPAQEKSAPVPPASFFWADVDGDELEDALVITPSGEARLLANRGDGTLTDVTASSGLTGLVLPRFAAWEDFDRDGDPDLYVGALGAGRLFEALGDGTFQDVTELAGIAHGGDDRHGGWLDFDRDGLPDLHVRTGTDELLFRNLGQGMFEPVELGLRAEPVPAELPFEVSLAGTPAAALTGDPSPGAALEREPTSSEVADETPRRGRRAVPLGAPRSEAGGTQNAGPGPVLGAGANLTCAKSIEDASSPGSCIQASSVPAMGRLYPLSADFFMDVSGYVGLGTTTPFERLAVAGRGLFTNTSDSYTVKGDSRFIPWTRGYLGVQGATDFDGVLTADWSGLEIGAVGISTGLSTTDNYGLIGHANGVGVRGEFAADPTGTYGELGTDYGRGIVASGSVLAGEFLGDVSVSGSVGIGTLSPANELDVVGDASVSGRIGVGTTSPTAEVDVAGRIRAFNTGSSHAVYGQAENTSHSVMGYKQTTSGRAGSFQIFNSANSDAAVRAETNGTGNAGLFSITNTSSSANSLEAGTLGTGNSIAGYSYGPGAALYGESFGPGPGIRAVKSSSSGGVAEFHHTNPASSAVAVVIDSQSRGDGVRVYTYEDVVGLASYAYGGTSYGLYGESPNIGVVGSSSVLAMWAAGDFLVTGNKNFSQPHPTDPSKELRFVCLEGNESGTYFRGSTRLVEGYAVIEVPEEFRMVSEEEGLTIQVTPVGAPASLWIESQDLERVIVRGNADVPFHYFVNGVRRGYADFQPLHDNLVWKPEERGVPYGEQYPDAVREILVKNGTLNPDFTPNEATADALGWKLRDPEQRPRPAPAPASFHEEPEGEPQGE